MHFKSNQTSKPITVIVVSVSQTNSAKAPIQSRVSSNPCLSETIVVQLWYTWISRLSKLIIEIYHRSYRSHLCDDKAQHNTVVPLNGHITKKQADLVPMVTRPGSPLPLIPLRKMATLRRCVKSREGRSSFLCKFGHCRL